MLSVKSINAILSQHHIKGQCNVIGVQKQYTVMTVREVCKEGFLRIVANRKR